MERVHQTLLETRTHSSWFANGTGPIIGQWGRKSQPRIPNPQNPTPRKRKTARETASAVRPDRPDRLVRLQNQLGAAKNLEAGVAKSRNPDILRRSTEGG